MLHEPIGSLKDTAKVATAPPETSVVEAAGLMLVDGKGAVVVIERGAIAGIFTENDVVSRVIAYGRDPAALSIGEVMTPDPVTVGPEAALGHALVLMRERGIRHLPVVEGGKLVGMVCARDALDPELEEVGCEESWRERLRCRTAGAIQPGDPAFADQRRVERDIGLDPLAQRLRCRA
jgi:CBS domain-containing protein